MKAYLVGGAVRDQLLGLPIKEKDWVVVGATVQEMLAAGFRQVGKDFPVFLHPTTKEEYALARTERKVGRGYTGFTFDTSESVTLEEDLQRRDLTINAMAETSEGQIIDPYHGARDLKNKILRHVSPAFSEDPVRILRVARFAARFNFTVAPETLQLMRDMVNNGEVNALVEERVFKEFERALSEPYPQQFFAVLTAIDAQKVLFPEITALGALENAIKLSHQPLIRFAALTSALNLEALRSLANRYRMPSDYRDLAILTIQHLKDVLNAENLTSEEIVSLFLSLDAFRREARFFNFLTICEACGSTNTSLLKKYYSLAKEIDTKKITADKSLNGKQIADKILTERINAIKSART
jgi:tRNA nucleotidyltransferase (CCA-adding enzyme)